MEQIDYLNLRTTNINIRISPLLKSALIEKGGKMGVNLSEYIIHLLTKAMTGEDKHCPSCPELETKVACLESALEMYEGLAHPFLDALEEGIFLNEMQFYPNSPFEILEILLSQFKPKQ